MKRLTLVRHGETTGQSSIRYYGSTDVPLSESGRAQMRQVATALLERRFDRVFSSRLGRSVEAAALITSNGLAQSIAAFDEVNFGNWEGWTRAEIELRDPENYAAWQRDGVRFRYPGGDSRVDFHARVADGLHGLLRDERGSDLLFVLHKGVIAVILTELLGLTPEQRAALAIDLGSIHVLEERAAGWESAVLNSISHLEQEKPRMNTDKHG